MTPGQNLVGSVASLLTALAACVAAIGTFVTVWQMRKQMEASYRPELTFGQVWLEAKAGNQVWPIPSYWIARAEPPQEHREKGQPLGPLPPKFGVRLYNVGLAAATNIRVAWNFPVEDLADEVNKLAQRALVPAYFDAKRGRLSFASEIWKTHFTVMWGNERTQSLDYLLPESVAHSQPPPLIEIPTTITVLISSWLYFWSLGKGDQDWSIPEARLEIDYRDIAGIERHGAFEFEFTPIVVGSDAFSLRIEPRKLR
jgi:hypothetical protein